MTSGLSPREYSSIKHSINLPSLLDGGVNIPYFSLQHAFISLIPGQTAAGRLASASIALAVAISIFYILRVWFGKTAAFFAGILVVATPWAVLLGRNASPDVMYLWPVILTALLLAFKRSQAQTGWWWILICVATAAALYTPAMPWLLLIALLFGRHWLSEGLSRTSRLSIGVGCVLGIAFLLPMVSAIVKAPSLAADIAGIPDVWRSPTELAASVLWSASSLVILMRNHIDIIVGRLPMMSILQTTFIVFGIYALSTKARKLLLWLFGATLFSVLVAGINGDPYFLSYGLMSLFVMMAAGLRYLYLEWRRVFPHNPFASTLALVLIALVVIAQLAYSVRYSLVAWPNTKQTKSLYVLKYPKE